MPEKKEAQEASVEMPMFANAGNVPQVALMPAHEYQGLMQAKVFEEAAKNPNNTTRPGGAFIVDGRWVDADGRPLKESDIKAHVEAKEGKSASAEDIKAFEEDVPTLLNEPGRPTIAAANREILADMTQAQEKADAKTEAKADQKED